MNVLVPSAFVGDTGAAFCEALVDLADQSHRIELDMSATCSIDSSAIRALFYTTKRLTRHGCDVVISAASPEATAYLELTRIPCYVPLPPVERARPSILSAARRFVSNCLSASMPWRVR